MKSIAIVGNTDQSQTLLADLLHWHGLTVFQVDSGEALLPLLSFISPELVIVETLTGIGLAAEAVCDRIKRSQILSHIPVLVCAQRCIGDSADAYLYAPYTAEDIFAYIQALRPVTASSDSVVTSVQFDV